MMKVLLIHGLSRTSLSLFSLEWRLRQVGYETEQFGYTAFLESYPRIVQRLRIRLQALSSQGSYGIVAHSLGGLLTRSALGSVTFPLPKQVVMLGTPNRLPRLALLAWQLAPFQWLTGQCGLNLASPNFFAQLPLLQSPYKIIAGTQGFRGFGSPFGFEVNDGIVALRETRLSESDRLLELPVNHTFMMNDRAVKETVVRALGLV
jgi:hypothetical protein